MSSSEHDNKRTILLLALLVFFAAWLIYADTLDNPFVYDDLVIIAENNNLDDPSNFRNLFTREYFSFSGERTYRPVVTAVYLAISSIAGKESTPFRTASVLAHAMAGVLLFFVALAVTGRRDVAIFAALIFVCHPLQSEAVDGSSFLEDPLSAVFFLGAFLAHTRLRRSGALSSLASAGVLYLLAMFTKESAAVFPLWALSYELLKPDMPENRSLKSKTVPFITYFIIALVFASVRFGLMANPAQAAAAAMPGHDVQSSVAVMAVAFLKYLQLFFMPFGYSIEHCISSTHSLTDFLVVISFIIHFLFLLTAFLFRRQGRSMSMGILFYFICLIPISNIVPFGAVMAERYMYLPVAGMSIFIAAMSLYRAPGQKLDAAAEKYELLMKVFLVCLCLFFASQTAKQNEKWNTGLSLWGEAAGVCPESSRARTNYGRRLVEAGMFRDAVGQLDAAVRLDPMHYEAWNALGTACFNVKDYSCAKRSYRRALDIHPSNDVRYNIAILQMRTGAPGKAVSMIERILDVQPDWPAANYLLGNAFLKNNQFNKAVKQYEKVLRLDPAHIGATVNMGAAYMRLGRNDEALASFRRALELEPGNSYAISNIKLLENRMKRTNRNNER